jgi:hypothetical protein
MECLSIKKLLTGFAIIATVAVGNAQAAPVLIDFEGVGNMSSILGFYNGGNDSGGNVGANNHGINFSNTSLGLIDLDAGGTGDFANEPSASTVLFFSGGRATMNVAAGFSNSLSFYYTSRPIGPLETTAFVDLYTGVSGTGSLITRVLLPTPTPTEHEQRDCQGDVAGEELCFWVPITVTFNGIAKSVDFGGEANKVLFDNIALDTVVPSQVSQVPVPAAFWLMGSGLLGLLKIKRKGANQLVV